ncbi:hypothetical protein H310_10178 [Aphanomyces invadans]|uniref:Uncharacterized protein n=1 Tax=Aphanomyces invadans TaxID=157072 RepID=A0A024TSF7_9STRA|nr:hypothetical protein H310_10178 [Aphanomyces invadans]ETV96904.1 hypothetical protein H310_10178 [Aphanomyces invadans]|eukprot:XP_008874681.1 hypothetical protein H310_10178 [Aphanomyces invadans]
MENQPARTPRELSIATKPWHHQVKEGRTLYARYQMTEAQPCEPSQLPMVSPWCEHVQTQCIFLTPEI